MPELPEVEVTRRGLAGSLEGAVIRDVVLGKPLRWPLGVDPSFLKGMRILQVGRRGKYLLFELDRGWLLGHLGMSGSLRWVPDAVDGGQPGKHDHVRVLTDRGALVMNDPRRFGALLFVQALSQPSASRLLGGLGVEPLSDDFTVEVLTQGLAARQTAIKQVLLKGDVVVGVGNIYASEALFRARIHPATPARQIPRRTVAALHDAIVQVLVQALDMGGSTLRNFSDLSGQSGHFQTATQVYGRSGQACTVCGTPIERMVQGQRATYFCRRCQPKPRGG
ncbi:Fpg/Nei family DNA glycosylase [Hydrogenophaga soli]